VKAKQKGAFMVELALVLMFFSGLFVAVANYVVAINTKGQLERAVYSMTTIMSERKQLFGGEVDICFGSDARCNETKQVMNRLMMASLKRMMPNFDRTKLGIQIEQLTVEGDNPRNFKKKYRQLRDGAVQGCQLPNLNQMSKEQALELLPITSHNRRLPMYQVTLCYETPFNIFGLADGEVVRTIAISFSFARV